MSECGDKIAASGEVTKRQAEEILQRIKNMAMLRAQAGEPIGQAAQAVAKELQAHNKFITALNQRNLLFNVIAKRHFKDFVARFDNPMTGIMAFLEGRNRDVLGARNSVDYNIKSINGKYFGGLVAQLEESGVLRSFRRNELTHEIYVEMGELGKEDGRSGISGSADAQKIAKIVDDVTKEMVARQNRAGAYIGNLPGYVVRQTHDMSAIRAEGRLPDGQLSQRESYEKWRDFTLPLLDHEKTFLGADTEKFMRNVHEGLYTGVHGAGTSQWSVGGWGIRGDLARKASHERVLHFSDAESAWKYNEKFGTRDFKEQVLTDIHNRSRAIGLMENLGPAPAETLAKALREIRVGLRSRDDAAKVLDAINENKVMASFRQLTGDNAIPANPTLARVSNNIRAVTQLAKMGSVLLTNLFSDRAFLQAEMAYQGISHLTTLGKQLTSLAKRTPEEKRMLRLMGVGLDGLSGNALSRYSADGALSGPIDRAQKMFFDINFHNYWTDSSKSAAAELMASHLGEHADMKYGQLPTELQRVLGLYDIRERQWDLLRKTAYDMGNGNRMITPDALRQLDLKPRELDRLETQLRTYFQDRVDMAVPTPGASERRITTGDTKAGTPLGEAIRLLMIFKSFPAAVLNKVITREVYGRGANSVGEWLLNDHKGKFYMAQLIAMTTAAGYLGMVLRDAINGKTPKELTTDGKINYDTLNEAAIRGGGLGLFGDLAMRDYSKHGASFLEAATGPVFSQSDAFAHMASKAVRGENVAGDVGKMTIDNTPLINLFYVRPVLNYYVLWNLETMMDPNRVRSMQASAERQHQQYYMGPAAK